MRYAHAPTPQPNSQLARFLAVDLDLSGLTRRFNEKFGDDSHLATSPLTRELDSLGAAKTPRRATEVWHYTTLSGMLDILQSRTLWATDAKFLNDPSEYKHALDVLREFAQTQLPADEFRSDLITRLANIGAFDSGHAPPLICSFSESADDMTQWRSYSDQGFGAALVFDLSKLSDAVLRCDGAWYKCTYLPATRDLSEGDAVSLAFHDLLKNWREQWSSYTRGDEEDLHERSTSLRENIRIDHSLDEFKRSIKHNSFASEREWRAVFQGRSAATSLRIVRGRVVPYRPIPLMEKGAEVTKVVMGPAFTDPESIEALQEWLANRTMETRVERSRHLLRR